mmetsp:Transcript_45972/g.103072  ORF Transcript_45972/g.103072 Transcript_45972/m.103072 type:complete len:239 (+) Transcript_45972:765-1481(+)
MLSLWIDLRKVWVSHTLPTTGVLTCGASTLPNLESIQGVCTPEGQVKLALEPTVNNNGQLDNRRRGWWGLEGERRTRSASFNGFTNRKRVQHCCKPWPHVNSNVGWIWVCRRASIQCVPLAWFSLQSEECVTTLKQSIVGTSGINSVVLVARDLADGRRLGLQYHDAENSLLVLFHSQEIHGILTEGCWVTAKPALNRTQCSKCATSSLHVTQLHVEEEPQVEDKSAWCHRDNAAGVA